MTEGPFSQHTCLNYNTCSFRNLIWFLFDYKWPNLKRESLDASIIWLWTNNQGTGVWDVMTHMCVTVMPMLQNAISQTPESHLGINNLRSGITYHKQLNVVFIQLFGNRWFIINSMFLKWFARNFEHIVKCITLLLIPRVLWCLAVRSSLLFSCASENAWYWWHSTRNCENNIAEVYKSMAKGSNEW